MMRSSVAVFSAQDNNGSRVAPASQFAAKAQTVHTGNHDVQDNEVILLTIVKARAFKPSSVLSVW